MKMSSVTSSNIHSIGHDPETSELHVKFKSGATHAYSGVSAAEHAALIGAESVGSHFHKNIRSKPNRKVE